MIFTKGIQKIVGSLVLGKSTRRHHRTPRVCNLSNAQTVGLVFHLHDSKELIDIKELIKDLSTQKIKVTPLIYIDTSKINGYAFERSIQFVCRRDYNWFHKPKTPLLKDFIRKEFDILINLSRNSILPVDFVMVLSKAKFKVGRYFDVTDNGDMMIRVTDDTPIKYLIEQTLHYLSVIKPLQK